MKLWLTILGVVLVVEGIPWFLSPRRVRTLLVELASFPDGILRALGLAAMAAGLLVVWLARG